MLKSHKQRQNDKLPKVQKSDDQGRDTNLIVGGNDDKRCMLEHDNKKYNFTTSLAFHPRATTPYIRGSIRGKRNTSHILFFLKKGPNKIKRVS